MRITKHNQTEYKVQFTKNNKRYNFFINKEGEGSMPEEFWGTPFEQEIINKVKDKDAMLKSGYYTRIVARLKSDPSEIEALREGEIGTEKELIKDCIEAHGKEWADSVLFDIMVFNNRSEFSLDLTKEEKGVLSDILEVEDGWAEDESIYEPHAKAAIKSMRQKLKI